MTKDLQLDKLTATSDPSVFSVSFEMTNQPKAVEGVSKLVQQVEKLLLTTPGTDAFRPLDGGGLKTLLTKNVARSQLNMIIGKVQTAITAVKAQITGYQADGNLPLDEQLQDLYLVDYSLDDSGPTVRVTIAVVSKSNIQAVSILP